MRLKLLQFPDVIEAIRHGEGYRGMQMQMYVNVWLAATCCIPLGSEHRQKKEFGSLRCSEAILADLHLHHLTDYLWEHLGCTIAPVGSILCTENPSKLDRSGESEKSLIRTSCMWLLILYAHVYVKSKSFQIQTFLFPFESCWEAFRRTYIYIGDQRRACGKACGEPCGVYALLIIPYHTMIL